MTRWPIPPGPPRRPVLAPSFEFATDFASDPGRVSKSRTTSDSGRHIARRSDNAMSLCSLCRPFSTTLRAMPIWRPDRHHAAPYCFSCVEPLLTVPLQTDLPPSSARQTTPFTASARPSPRCLSMCQVPAETRRPSVPPSLTPPKTSVGSAFPTMGPPQSITSRKPSGVSPGAAAHWPKTSLSRPFNDGRPLSSSLPWRHAVSKIRSYTRACGS